MSITEGETRGATRPRRAAARLQVVNGTGEDHRQVVRIVAGELSSLTSRVEDLLIESGAEIYCRGTTLVRAVDEKQIAAGGATTSTVALLPIDKVYMRDQIAERIRFERFDQREKAWVTVNPPMDIAETLLARKGNWKFRIVGGVINAPTLRVDGSLLIDQGYDERTGLILRGSLTLPKMNARPTKEGAMKALAALQKLLDDFPFVLADGETKARNAARSVALSMLITPVVRGCMDVAPLHAATAPSAGTGKSMLANVAAAIALGERCSIMGVGSNDEETEKRLGAAAMAGHPIISLDNCNGELGGNTLCQLISESSVNLRILGQSANVRVSNRFVLFTNGNNLRLRGDVCRRTITCRLNAGMERPSERVFTSNPFDTVIANRGFYVAACLVIVQAYFAAGRPQVMVGGKPLVPMNSFEQWSATVRSALIWLGCADPAATVALAQEDDPERRVLAAFLAAFEAEVGIGKGSAHTATELLALAEKRGSHDGDSDWRSGEDWSCPKLREAIRATPTKPGSSGSFGRWLASVIDTTIGSIAVKSMDLGSNRVGYYADTAT